MIEHDQIANKETIWSTLEHKSAYSLYGYARSSLPVRQFLRGPLSHAQVFAELLDVASAPRFIDGDVRFTDVVHGAFHVFTRSGVDAVHMELGPQHPLGGV